MKRANRPCWPRRKLRVNTKSPIKKTATGSARLNDNDFSNGREDYHHEDEKTHDTIEATERDLESNRYEITEKDNVKGLIYGDSDTWETYRQPRRYEAANYPVNTYEPESDDGDREQRLLLNRLKITENDNVKNLIYGNPVADETASNPQPAIRKHLSREITSKIGSRWENLQNEKSCTNHKTQERTPVVENYSDEVKLSKSLRANRNACLGGSSMKDILSTNAPKVNDRNINKPRNQRIDDAPIGKPWGNNMMTERNGRNTNLPRQKNQNQGASSHPNLWRRMNNNEGLEENDDQFDYLRANRNACLDGTSMKDVMTFPVPKQEKEIYKKPGHSQARKQQEPHFERQYGSLRENRESCLGGSSMKNIMTDTSAVSDHNRKPRSMQKQETLSKVEADDDQYESLRANRTACLGGASVKDIMHRDPSPIERGMHKNRGQNAIKKMETNPFKANLHKQYQSLNANRTASLGGANMKEIMTRDSTARDIQKCYKRPDNNIKKEKTGVVVKDDALQRNRMKILNSSTLVYGTPPTRKTPINRKKLPNKSDKSTVTATSQIKQNSQNQNQMDEMRSNRIKAMGGRVMENIIQRKTTNANTSTPCVGNQNKSKNEPNQSKLASIEGPKPSNDAHKDGNGVQSSTKTTTRKETSGRKRHIVSSKKKVLVKPSNIKSQNKQNSPRRQNDAPTRMNRATVSDVQSMKNSERDNIEHVNESRENIRSGEESAGTSSTGVVANSDMEQYKYEELRANRVAGIGGETMRFLIYGRGASSTEDNKPTSRNSKKYPTEWIE